MTLNGKDEETIQNEEQKETEEPLLAKTQSIIIDRSQGTPGRMVSPAGASEDVIVSLIGQKGWWQLRTTLAIFLTKIPAAWFMACIIFTAPQPWYGEYECDITTQETSNGSIYPVKITADGEYQNDFCYVFKNASQTIKTTSPLLRHNIEPIIEPCETFHYNLDPKTTLITQFDLVCSRSILVAITQCFHLFGVLLGGIFATEAMEFYSPRKVMMCGMVLQIACGIITGYVPYFWLHVAFRCLSAVCCALTFTPGMAIMADIWGGKYKTIVSANFEQFWSIGVILLPAIGYYTNTWAQIYVTISLPTVLIMILWWWIPDPPRWHLERSDIKTAQKIIENAILVNNKNGKMSVPDNLQEMLKIEAHVLIRKRSIVKKSKWIELLSIKGASWRLFSVATSWSLMFTCYYGALLNIRSFGREYLYVNTAIAGLSELIGGAFGFVILMQTKRKWLWIGIFTAITGIINCTIWFFPSHVNGSHMLYDLMGIAMLNKVGISASLCVLTTCTAELFPLPHKKRAVYTSTVCARIIFMTAPLIGFTAIFGDGVSMSFFGVLTFISGLLTLLLNPVSETKDTTANKSNVWTVKMQSEQTKL